MEFITQNGQKEVVINIATFKDASNLRKALMKSIMESDFANSLDKKTVDNVEFGTIIDVALKLILNTDISESFEKAIFECLKICTYDGKHKITPDFFDAVKEAREDYYEIVSKCCEENLRPFFKSLVSEFQTRFKQLEQNPKLKSMLVMSNL